MDPVTLIGLVATAVLFLSGVGLVWIGLARRSDALPDNAAAVLEAVQSGDLRDAGRSYPTDDDSSVRLVPRPDAAGMAAS